MEAQPKVLLVIDQCNPEMPSVPLVGYQFFKAISENARVTLVTHERNRAALTKNDGDADVMFVPESKGIRLWYRLVAAATIRKSFTIWPVLNALCYPVYAEFDRRAFRMVRDRVERGDFDIVHAITPMMPRFPVKLGRKRKVRSRSDTKFVLGPVNGGLRYPRGFGRVAFSEFAPLNFFRHASLALPGYAATYLRADRVLVGSTSTLNQLSRLFDRNLRRFQLFYENGIPADFFDEPLGRASRSTDDPLRLLFVGRLVPYKGAGTVVDAVANIASNHGRAISLTIVGDGPERSRLEAQASQRGIADIVRFTGWIPFEDTLAHYREADVFCFPSIREFGGAVVLEAMANGLPCIVVNNGGIGEYVTDQTGIRVSPQSQDELLEMVARSILSLADDPCMVERMSAASRIRAREFEWSSKGREVRKIYDSLLESRS